MRLPRPFFLFTAAMSFAAALGAPGCGGEELGFAEKAELEEQEQALQLDLFCDCWADFATPFDSKEACVAGLTIAPNQTVEQCRVDAYELAPESSHAHLDCRLEVLRQTSACLAETYTCTDTNTFAECDAVRVDGLAACPPLATVVVDAHIACAQSI